MKSQSDRPRSRRAPLLPRSFFGLAAVLCLLVASLDSGRAQPWAQDPAIEARIDALIPRMTLAEKLGQLNQFSEGAATGPTTGRGNYAAMIAAGEIGALLNVSGAKADAYQRIAVEQSRLGIPLLFGMDVVHGYRTIFPVPLGLSASWDPALVERTARIAAAEARADGVHWTFAPMVDIARDARWGRIVEGAGEDPYLGSAMARAYVRGFQGRSLADPGSVAATLKHYAGYGAAEGGRDYNTTDIPERTLRQVYLPPFRAGVEEGAATLMAGFNALNGVPASANAFLLDEILRREWGFRGFVVSDWRSVAETIAHGTALDGAEASRKAVLSGLDMDMESNLYRTALRGEAGAVPEAVIDRAVRRILRVKLALGLFERPYSGVVAGPRVRPQPAALAVAREAAARSFVLLKNSDVLPLDASADVALIGPMAGSASEMLGAWPGRGDARDATTLREALGARIGGRLAYARGTGLSTTSEAGFAAAVRAARRADVAVLALGERAHDMTGEAASRTDLGLPGNQQALLEAVVATGTPVVLLVFSGRPLVLDWASQNVPALAVAWHPGLEGGPALAAMLMGDTAPSGRLTVSFPRSVGQQPLYYNQLNTGRPVAGLASGGVEPVRAEKYTSRYIDEPNAALYPFGFGLSYTTFAYGPVVLDTKAVSAAEVNGGRRSVRVSAEVRNIGDRAGVETAQLYIGQRGTSVARPVRELKGFVQVRLEPGQAATVRFTLDRAALAFWNIDMEEVVEPGSVRVWVAGSSVDGRPAEFRIE